MYVEDDGVKKVYGQSNAILRYIGKLGGKHFLKIIPYQDVCLYFFDEAHGWYFNFTGLYPEDPTLAMEVS